MRYELFLSARGRLANEAEGGRTFYDVLSETIEDPDIHLFLFIDEAHRGLGGDATPDATNKTIYAKLIDGQDGKNPDVIKLGKTFKKLVVEPNYNQAVNELNMGAVDAVALDVGVAKKKMADLPGKFELLKEIVMSETYGIGFKLGNVALKDQVEDALRELADDGTMKVLAGKYGIEENALILWKK